MWTNRNCFFISKIDIWPLIKFHILSISLLRREFNIKKWMVSLCATMLYHTLIIIKMASLKIIQITILRDSHRMIAVPYADRYHWTALQNDIAVY